MFRHTLKYNEAGEKNAGAPPASDKDQPKDSPTHEKDGDNNDEFGYKKAAEEKKEGEKNEKPPEKPKEEKVEVAATGYAEEPVVTPEDAPPEKKEEPKVELEYELDLKDLPDGEDAKIKEFAKINKLSKEAAQAFADFRKIQEKSFKDAALQFKKEQEAATKQLKAKWYKELKEDKDFGGEKFSHNIMQVEKLVDQFLPETKKVLTERKSMLPPYVMRDLSNFAEHLYQQKEKLVTGEPSKKVEKQVEDEFEHLKFYGL